MNILRMKNPVQGYTWGSKTFIQNLTSATENIGIPQAELWMGAHPLLPSQLINGEKYVSLTDMISKEPKLFLGEDIVRRFGNRLPFLMKILAAEKPLSIQAHPDAEQAVMGFNRENELKIPLDAPERNYKDPYHKPELIIALTQFTALCGFRPANEIQIFLSRYLKQANLAAIHRFVLNPSNDTLKEFYLSLFSLNKEQRHYIIQCAITNLEQNKTRSIEENNILTLCLKLQELYPDDLGVLAPFYLNLIVLQPEEGLFLPSRTLHSYISGCGIEIMANSDNVIRGGLTSKHIDVDELIKTLDYQFMKISPISYNFVSINEKVYQTYAEEFCLSLINLNKLSCTNLDNHCSAEILFCYEGDLTVENCSQLLNLKKGQSVFVPGEVDGYSLIGKGTLFRARVNQMK